MLGTYIEIILYPVRKYLEMLTDTVIASHLGVSVLGIAVTCAITIILVNALVYRINVGYSFRVKDKTFATPIKKSQNEIAIEQAKQSGHSLYRKG